MSVENQTKVAIEASPRRAPLAPASVGTTGKTNTRRIVGVIGSRSLPRDWSARVGLVTEDLLQRGCHIASGGAIGADEYCLSQLVHIGESSKATLYSPWATYEGFPVKVRALTRQFKEYGGHIVWGSLRGGEEYPVVRTGLLQRNLRLIEAVSGVVAFIHAESNGTIFTLRKALASHLAVVVFCIDRALPEFEGVRWKALKCGGCWDGSYKAVYLR